MRTTIEIRIFREDLLRLAREQAASAGISEDALAGLEASVVNPEWDGCDTYEQRAEALATGCDPDAIVIRLFSWGE